MLRTHPGKKQDAEKRRGGARKFFRASHRIPTGEGIILPGGVLSHRFPVPLLVAEFKT
jgi:hypothetical protein